MYICIKGFWSSEASGPKYVVIAMYCKKLAVIYPPANCPQSTVPIKVT